MAFDGASNLPLWQNGPSPGVFYNFPGSQHGTGGFQKSMYVLSNHNSQVFNLFEHICVRHNLISTSETRMSSYVQSSYVENLYVFKLTCDLDIKLNI